MGDGIPKGGGELGEIEDKFCNVAPFSTIVKYTKPGTTEERSGNWEYKVWDVGNSDPPAPQLSCMSNLVSINLKNIYHLLEQLDGHIPESSLI